VALSVFDVASRFFGKFVHAWS